jgi:hypothetical protein
LKRSVFSRFAGTPISSSSFSIASIIGSEPQTKYSRRLNVPLGYVAADQVGVDSSGLTGPVLVRFLEDVNNPQLGPRFLQLGELLPERHILPAAVGVEQRGRSDVSADASSAAC